ncbi:MAG: hypothetical protein ABJN36_15770 [Cyclobacteriaceae bacterium]
MKKLLILIAILLLGGAGYFTYTKWVKDANLTNWSFVPQNALVVYESSAPLATLEDVKQTGIWKNVISLPLFSSMEENLDILDTLAGTGNFKSLFKNTNTLISLHQTSSSGYDFLYIVDIDKLSKHAFVSKALAYFRDLGYSIKTREYLDFTITELKTQGSPDAFTFIFYKNFFIGSFSAFLVEDGIRTVVDKETNSFQKKFSELQKVSKLTRDQGNLYLNLSRYDALINGIVSKKINLELAKSSFLDLRVEDHYFNLSGFTFLDEPTQFLSTMTIDPGSAFDMAEIIPLETAWMYHYNMNDAKEFANKLESYCLISDNGVLKKREELIQQKDFDVTYAYQLIDEEIGLITLEQSRPTREDRMLILEIKDMGEALNFFNSMTEREAAKSGDTVYVETYGNYEIRKLPVEEFPYALLGNIALGFKSSFYIQHRNYLIFCNNLLQLKNFTRSIENENTWGKSLKFKKMLDQGNQAANFSMFINTPRAWTQSAAALESSWAGFAKDYQFAIKNLEFITAQFSAVDNKFYTNITAHQPYIPSGTIPDKVTTLESVALPDFIITKPYIITNHTTRDREVVVQDSSNHIHQFSSGFDALWSRDVGSKTISDIEQIDYYKNGKLQIAFATKSEIHIIDRTGEYIPGFPKKIPGERDAEHFKIIDYDNSKNYRFAIADTKGNVYLTDKDVKPLSGWAPRKFDSPIVQAPEHHRIGRKDVIIVVQKNGKVNVLNRRGDQMEKFPMVLDTDIRSKIFVKETNELKSSSIHLVTVSGETMEISLAGSLINRDQLYKPSASTDFKLISDISKESFVLLRNTERKYEVLSESGESLFGKDYFTDKTLYTQYYKLGGGTNFILLTDPSGSYLYIYDMSGKLVTGRPLAATMPIAMLKYENEYQIYRIVDKNLELISLSF